MPTERCEHVNRQFKGYYFTNHLLDRFEDRFANRISHRFPNLIWKDTRNVGAVVSRLLNESYLDDSIKNNTVFMVNCWEAHGYDRKYQFYVNKEYGIVFVLVEETKDQLRKFITTCLNMEWIKGLNSRTVIKKEKKQPKFRMSDEMYYEQVVQGEKSYDNIYSR